MGWKKTWLIGVALASLVGSACHGAEGDAAEEKPPQMSETERIEARLEQIETRMMEFPREQVAIRDVLRREQAEMRALQEELVAGNEELSALKEQLAAAEKQVASLRFEYQEKVREIPEIKAKTESRSSSLRKIQQSSDERRKLAQEKGVLMNRLRELRAREASKAATPAP